MKKRLILSIGILLNLLTVTAQVQPVQPQLTDSKSFSMILLPDPQSYTKFDVNQPLFELMTAWTANNKERLNIEAVLCTGDLVEQNEIRIPDGVNGNQTSEEQWKAASQAFARLDNKLPYVICTGNHDYGYEKSELYGKFNLQKGLKNFLIDDKGVIIAANVTPDQLTEVMNKI